MKVEELAKYIGMEEIPESWIKCVEQVINTMPSELEFLTIEKTNEIFDFYKIEDKELEQEYKKTIEEIKNDEKLKIICYLFHYILYKDNKNSYNDIYNWKIGENLYKQHGSYMINLVSMLSGYEKHKKEIKELNYDIQQIEEQKKNIRKICNNDRKLYGINGIRFSQMVWGSNFMNGRLIQIGRLQYELRITNNKDKLEKIKKYYNNKDYVYIHIPEDKNLLEKDVDESIKNAKKYIPLYFKEIDIDNAIFYTLTWLLSEELDDILDKESNIIKFKNKFTILEQNENEKAFLNFVFKEGLKEKINYSELKEDTSLQRKIKQYLLEGKKLHIGFGILKN